MLNISIDQSLQKEFEKRDRLSGLFPGIHCGNPACVAFCAETLDIAKKLNLDCKKHLSAEIKEKIVSKYGCRGVTGEAKGKNICRFGYAIPGATAFFDTSDAAFSGSTVEYVEAFTFDASQENCEKCRSMDGVTVTEKQMQDDTFMKKMGFYRQDDGVYRPHPHCKCIWNKVKKTVDLNDYSWKCLKEDALATYAVTIPIPNFYLADYLIKKLAERVRLDENEAFVWMQNINIQKHGNQTTITVDVPNVWLCIDLLQGGSLEKRLFINHGGTIGQVISYVGSYGMKKVFCRSIDEMYAAFKTYWRQIWGFVLYAHGSRFGSISESNGKKTSQAALLSAVDNQGYKLAKVYLMQCYSGRNKDFEIKITYDELWNNFYKQATKDIKKNWQQKSKKDFMKNAFPQVVQRIKNNIAKENGGVAYISGTWNENEMIFKMKYQWDAAWGTRTVKGEPNISYQGKNFLVIDWAFLETIVETLENFIP